MNRKSIIILGCCFVFAMVFMIGLYAATRKIVHEPNSFLREYDKFTAEKANELDVKFNSYYIAGVTHDHIYLGNITAPYKLLVTNHALTDTQHVTLIIKNMEKPKVYRTTFFEIDSPYFYMADGVMPALYRGKLGEWEAERFMFDSTYFTRLVPIGTSSFAIRTNSYPSLDNILGKVQRDTPNVKLEPGLLEKQVDGIFCTDGELFYNRELKKLVYTYYYRNGYIVYDTNLNLEYRGHTIDTFTRSQIKVGYIKSEDSKTLTYKKFINPRSWTSGNYLFIFSNLLAKNDPEDLFDQVNVIDVYDLTNNEYKFSFFLANYPEKTRLNDLVVYKNKVLFSIYDHYLIRYDLKSDYF